MFGGRSSEGAFAVRPSAPSAPSARSNATLDASSRLERARTRVGSRGGPSRISLRRLATRTSLAHVSRGTRLTRRQKSRRSPRPILRAPHDVADVLYYRLTKVMWRDSPPGHGDRDASERASERRSWAEKKNEKEEKGGKKIGGASEEIPPSRSRCSLLLPSLSPLAGHATLSTLRDPNNTKCMNVLEYFRYRIRIFVQYHVISYVYFIRSISVRIYFSTSSHPSRRGEQINAHTRYSRCRWNSRSDLHREKESEIYTETRKNVRVGHDRTHPHGVRPSWWKPRWQRGRRTCSRRERQ